MCGVTGTLDRAGVGNPSTLSAMVDALAHRGPDDAGQLMIDLQSGVLSDPTAPRPLAGADLALGFDRLSILDLSDRGHQPMVGPSGHSVIVYNGEIYNAFELRSELQARGYQFRSETDTEVLLALFDEYGIEGLLDRVNGMFAFALADLRGKRLLLARDRLGIKPLYWCQIGTRFLFASEPKAFLHDPSFDPAIDPAGVEEYFAFRYPHGSLTLFAGVQALEPGHWLEFGPTMEAPSLHRYWSVPSYEPDHARSLEDTSEELITRLSRSVEMRLLSDVPVGCQLSGGVDSSTVSRLAATLRESRFSAIGVVPDTEGFSEEPWMREAAEVAGVDLHAVSFDGDYFLDHFALATWHKDQALNLPNAVGIMCLAEEARKHVTVLLSGEGADELMGGYSRFYYAGVRQRLRILSAMLRRVPRPDHVLGTALGRWGARDAIDELVSSSAFVSRSEFQRLLPAVDPADVIARRRQSFRDTGALLPDFIDYELRTYLVDLLERQDRMTMAHSIENRVPFLDHTLVEFTRRVPIEHFVRPGLLPQRKQVWRGTKVALKEDARSHFGDEFAFRTKEGFDIPLMKYFAASRFRSYIESELLPSLRQRGIVDASFIEDCWREVLEGDPRHLQPLWAGIAFEQWARLFIDRAPLPPRAGLA